jgi:hypothetical protein
MFREPTKPNLVVLRESEKPNLVMFREIGNSNLVMVMESGNPNIAICRESAAFMPTSGYLVAGPEANTATSLRPSGRR